MLQCFNNRQFTSSLHGELLPRLVYSCKTEHDHVSMPRAMHMHENIAEIVFVASGEGYHIIDGRTYQTKKGDLLIYNAKVLHDEIAANDEIGLNVYCLGITDLYYPNLKPNSLIETNSNAVYNSNEQYTMFLHMFEYIHTVNISDGRFNAELISYLLCSLLTMLKELTSNANAPTNSPKKNEVYNQIKRYLDAHYTDNINLDNISKGLHLSVSYISHLFHEVEGISPRKYIIRRRIGEAQSLLINTNESVIDIARKVGYRNTNYFHSSFLKNVGLTPRGYRRYWIAKMSGI